MDDPATECSRRRAIERSGLVAAGSIAALAGCTDEGPGEADDGDGGDEQIEHPDEADDETNGGGGGPIDEEDTTGGDPDHDEDAGDG